MHFKVVGICAVLLLFCSSSGCAHRWPHLLKAKQAKSSPAEQAATVVEMIGRLLPPEYTGLFAVTVDPDIAEDGLDVFVLETLADGPKLQISGSTGVAAAWGLQYYLKKYCGSHVSWSGVQLALPSVLPVLSGQEKVVANDLFRYYQNVCTVSYSFVWWDWTRWEQEIDWMALNGINLPLAFNGQEEIFRRVYLALNFTQSDLDEFFAGPPFEAWGRMGNIDGWGGPISDGWYQSQVQLQHRILERMRGFGMTPVLPAFSGHVPRAITRVYPQAKVTQLDDWNGFNATYCCTYLLDHTEPLFQTIGTNFILELKQEFGVDHVYNCDTFNEMTPPSDDPAYVTSVGQSIFSALTSADPDALWLMQGWLFLEDYWTPELVRALVTSVPIGRMIVLDLHSDVFPLYQNFESYYGQPFVWCMLNNFGGTKGLYGSLSTINPGPFEGRSFPNSSMVGTGLTPEGIEQNDVIYEFMNEMAWRKEPVPDLDEWAGDYAARRYGVDDDDAAAGWRQLFRSAYNCTGISFHGQFIVATRPSLNSQPVICYNSTMALLAWDSFVLASSRDVAGSDLYRHDLVDVTREALVVGFAMMYRDLVVAFRDDDLPAFEEAGFRLLDLLHDFERILATDRRFLLGTWLERAKAASGTPQEAGQFEYYARNQVTLWGPAGEILDYATKLWSGIVTDYYRPRWLLFVRTLQELIQTDTPFNQTQFDQEVFEQAEEPFTFATKVYPTEATGDTVAVAQEVYAKWRNAFEGPELRVREPPPRTGISSGSLRAH